ncbi:MAG: NAD(P)-binding domain-containing protein, partial [Saprospiraceae bacterium]|nr:NAD(P)-binding domain-containing protein [Saprospiraceae bacterium]
MEELIIYSVVGLLCFGIMYIYLRKLKNESDEVTEKIEKAKEDGIHEPVSLYPYINEDNCIKSGACITACPEHDILGIRNGRATLVNASRCIGHGACFHACPVEAITLKIGTEKRGVDLPHVNQNFETNVQGMYIAGELGGMGLIKNSVEQGKQAVDHIKTSLDKSHIALYDLIIIGAGPAGISASLQAKNYGLNAIVLEQDSLGGTVYNFPRAKIVMTSPMDLPCYGKVKLFQTSKS